MSITDSSRASTPYSGTLNHPAPHVPAQAPKTRRFSNFKRLQLLLRSICRFLPQTVDLQTAVNCPAPSPRAPLQGPHRHYEPVRPCAPHRYSRTRSVRCLWFSLLRPKTLAVSIAATGSPDFMPAPAMSSRHLYTGHRRGHIQAAPRLRAHRSGPLSRDHPQIPVSMPSLFRFDASAVVHTCSSSHRTPAPLTARRQPQRSPPRLLTDAACGGLESPPPRQPRRTYLHHWHSTDRADDLLHHHHFPSGHIWVPETLSWLVRRLFGIR